MAKAFEIRLNGMNDLVRKMERRFGPRPVKKAIVRALVEEAEDLIGEAKLEVPVDTGNLRASGTVLPPKLNGDVECGFGGAAAQYALTVHETHRLKSKYLERPFNKRLKGFASRMAKELKGSLGI